MSTECPQCGESFERLTRHFDGDCNPDISPYGVEVVTQYVFAEDGGPVYFKTDGPAKNFYLYPDGETIRIERSGTTSSYHDPEGSYLESMVEQYPVYPVLDE